MVDWLLQTDVALLLALNGMHTPWADSLMWIVSGKLIWIPLYALLVWLLWRNFGHQIWRTLLLAALLIVLTDQGSGVVKDLVKRPRPTHNQEISASLHIVNDYRGGPYGFVSSHAANTFGLALFAGLLLGRRNRAALPLLLGWATIVSLSRVYLGVHYPADILAGALWGALCGWLMAWLHRQWLPREMKFRFRRP